MWFDMLHIVLQDNIKEFAILSFNALKGSRHFLSFRWEKGFSEEEQKYYKLFNIHLLFNWNYHRIKYLKLKRKYTANFIDNIKN